VSWSIEISDAAHEDLRDIYSYIAFELRSPENARNVLRRILAQVATLDEMPERFRPYPREPLSTRGVRVMDVGNFCVYYLPKDGVVSVGRILYCKRNVDAVFANGWE
jgi:toxin ParE1/3/4